MFTNYLTPITGFGENDYLTVSYDASTGAVPPIVVVRTLDDGDQVILADGVAVAHLVQPDVPATPESIELVGLFTSA